MPSNVLKEYSVSAEELAMSFSMINRPDLGKAVLFENNGELPQLALEERLRASSHSLLARKCAEISKDGIAVLSEDFQSVLRPMVKFKGMIQLVVNEVEPIIQNIHLGLQGEFTSHWIGQGVVHHLVTGSQEQLAEMVLRFVSLPASIPDRLNSQIQSGKYKLRMETIAELSEISPEKGLTALTHEGLDPQLSKALLEDVHQPRKRGSVSYLDVDPETLGKQDLDMAVAGLLFITGKSGWLFSFPKNLTDQIGLLTPGTSGHFEKKFKELHDRKEKAFIG